MAVKDRATLKSEFDTAITDGGGNTAAEIRSAHDDTTDSHHLAEDLNTLAKLNGVVADATLVDTASIVLKALFDANTILSADSDNTPAATTIAPSQFVARLAAGDIKGATVAEILTLLNVEAGATADQTAAEIRTAVEAATDSNVFTDADHTKLNVLSRLDVIALVVDGADLAVPVNTRSNMVRIPKNCDIVSWRILSHSTALRTSSLAATGAVNVAIQKSDFTDPYTVDATLVTATLASTDTKNEATGLSVAVAAGDFIFGTATTVDGTVVLLDLSIELQTT